MKYKIALILSLIVFCNPSCTYKRKKSLVQRDSTITKNTSFNTIFLDSTQLIIFINTNKQFEPFSDQFEDFYSHRNYEFAWFDSTGLSEEARNFISVQHSYISEFSDSTLYNEQLEKIVDSLSNINFIPHQNNPLLLKTELLLTGQFFKYVSKVYKGSDINTRELGWFIPRKKINLAALLDTAIQTKTKEPGQYAPQNSQYKKLQEYFIAYSAQEKKNTSDSIPRLAKPLRKGDSVSSILKIKQLLAVLGDLKQYDGTVVFDTALLAATKRFQRRMGLSIDGVIGNNMIGELNVPLKQRIRQLLVNMERMRWMPPEKDGNYILVNIPEYKMHVYDSGHQQFEMNVIVGTAANNTVIFTGNLHYVVFSPYWNVPESIVKKEIIPELQKNPGYIAKNNMEITGYTGGIPLVRQKPGSANSLGLVKFLFPNNYNIYFHDTPNRELFELSSRSFSHGCIRLGEAKKFAQYLLQSDTAWNNAAIDSAMHLDKEKWVAIKKTIPVFIVYFTAWVDKDGRLNFRKDIYGHDAKMQAKLFAN